MKTSYFKWSEELSTGVEQFDKDHKYLIQKINELHSGLISGFKISEMAFILDDLTNYTKTHFAREEELMKKYSYLEYEFHKAQHEALIKQVDDFQKRLAEGKKSFSLELLLFLKDWLTNHIMKTDKKYSDFFKKVLQA